MKAFVAIALGSNIGDPAENIRIATSHMAQFLGDMRLSPLYASAPMYNTDQPDFINAVAVGETDLCPHTLLKILKGIESDMGRVEGGRNGPRLIDLDIVLYGDEIVERDGLHIPHPRMAERPFVLVPLAQLAPDRAHPVLKKRMADMAKNLVFDRDDLREV